MNEEDNKPDQPAQSSEIEQPEQPQARPVPRCVYCGMQPMSPTIYIIPGPVEDTRVYACAQCGAVINFQAIRKAQATAPLIAQAGSMPPRLKM